MKRFTIQSPDGRTLEVEGEQEPTEQEMKEIFAQIPMQEKQEKKNKYTKLEKFVVGAIPITTSIAGGIAGAPAGIPGILAGGAIGSYSGRMISDNLEAVFGGEERTQEEMLKRAGKDAIVDLAFTAGTMGTGNVLKLTGGDKVIKSVASKAFKPLKDAFVNMAKPVKIAKEAKEVIKKTDARLLEIDVSISRMTDNLIDNTAKFTGKAVEIADNMLKKYSDDVTSVIAKVKPELDKGSKLARETISEGYDDLLFELGNVPANVDIKDIVSNMKEINIDNNMINDIISVIPDAKNPLFGDVHNLKLKLDDTISMLKSGRDKVAKRVIGGLSEIRDGIAVDLGEQSDGLYFKLSENYKRLLAVEKNADNALGTLSSGSTEGIRGKSLSDLFTKEKIKKIPKDYDVLSETTGRIGKINSQINLLENIGTEETINSANKMKEGLREIYSSFTKKINYEDMAETFKKINLKAIDGENISMNDLRKLSGTVVGKTKKDSVSLKELVERRSRIKNIKKEAKSLEVIKKQNQLALELATKDFSSFNDRYIPMISAVSISTIFPALSKPAITISSLYTLYKMKSVFAHSAIEAIEAISKQTTKKLSKIPFSQKSQVIYSKFATGLINKIRNEEEGIYDGDE